ncbi:MAG: uncharacterized membrane protein YebE (DUF533 family) [Pseudohongiellaceae bacterium]|jgi:uncharacterized membrane protein YebE (DUF533 family)
MNMQNILNQFMAPDSSAATTANATQGLSNGFDKLTSKIPGGLVGGAAAGGVMALILGNKKARGFAGNAATLGGAALLGGIAFKAFSSWKQNAAPATTDYKSVANVNEQITANDTPLSVDFQLVLIKAMIAAAKADGHINNEEQQRIFNAVDTMQLSYEVKGLVFELLRQPIFLEELAHSAITMEQKSEVYLVSCLAINTDHPSEKIHLETLANLLKLPTGLPEQIKWQAQNALEREAA